jgi:hypothetical protein
MPLITAAFDGSQVVGDLAYAIVPEEIDPRMMLQMSMFTIHNAPTSLAQHARAEEFLLRFEIPGSKKALIRRELELFGMRASNLFPDLEHLAEEVATKKFVKPR